MSRNRLEVRADLVFASGRNAIRVRSDGGPIVVDLPVGLLRSTPTRVERRRWADRLDRALAFAGLTARFRALGTTILQLGEQRRVTLLSRLLGIAPGTER